MKVCLFMPCVFHSSDCDETERFRISTTSLQQVAHESFYFEDNGKMSQAIAYIIKCNKFSFQTRLIWLHLIILKAYSHKCTLKIYRINHLS